MTDLLTRIRQELDGKRLPDGSIMCRCPAHNDVNPSLHISHVNNKLLIYCMAGCTQEAVILALQARNLWTSTNTALTPTSPSTAIARPVKSGPGIFTTRHGKTLTKTWSYKDQSGKLLGYVARYDGGKGQKEVIPYFNWIKSRWSPGALDPPRPLYGLELLAKAPKDLTIWVVEGEKCADALRKARRLAVTSLGGTNASRLTDWSPLAGRKIIIWPDHDEPGHKYAADVRGRLEALTPPAVIDIIDTVRLGLKEKEDAYDWLQANPVEKLAGLPIKTFKPFYPSIILEDYLMTEFSPIEMVLDPWIPTQGICMLHSRAGVGKTYVAIEIAYAVVTGGKALKWQAPEPRGVLYVDGEMAAGELHERLSKAYLKRNCPQLTKPLMIYSIGRQPSGSMPDISTTAGQKKIEEELYRKGKDAIELIILDNLSCLTASGVENEAESWIPIQKWLLKLKSEGKAVLVIHHSGKGGAQRGTSKREDAMNTIVTLKRNPLYEFEEGAKFEFHYEKGRSIYGLSAQPFEAQLVDGEWLLKDLKNVTLQQVKLLYQEGCSAKEIAEALGKSKQIVHRYIKNIKKVNF